MKSKNFNLDNFLKDAERRRCTCFYCNDKAAGGAVEAYLDKKAAGETHVSLNYMFDHCFVPIFEAPKCQRSLYRHVKHCLGRDHVTGKPL